MKGLAILSPPESVSLKSPDHFKILGTSVKSKDTAGIANGSAVFGMDVQIPGMLFASIVKCPTYGGKVRSFDDTAVRRLSGIEDVFKVDHFGHPDHPYCREGVAVVGASTWAVLKGRQALVVDWDHGPNTGESTEKLHRDCQALIEQGGSELIKDDGDFYVRYQESPQRFEAVYHVPFIAHATMEVINCTIDLKEKECELWVGTQMPNIELHQLSNLLEMPLENIKLHVPRIGGGYGRRLGIDGSIEAISVARRIKKPVKVFWTREDDIAMDGYRPFSYHRLMAGFDEKGRLTSWLHRQAGASRYAFREGRQAGASEFFPNHFPANLVSDFRQEYSLAVSNLNRSLIRAPGNNALGFVVESFVDELAHFTQKDPLAFRLELLGEEDQEFLFDEEEESVISTARMRGVLELAAEKAGWGREKEKAVGRGIAGYFTFDTYVAHVAEVSVDPDTGALDILKFTSAVDCGLIAHLDGVKAQVEGAVHDGISATLLQEITVQNGRTDQQNFHDYHLLRMGMAPKEIDVHVVKNAHPPTGMGEPPYPPVASALCNAIFDACGLRVRKLPVGDQLKK